MPLQEFGKPKEKPVYTQTIRKTLFVDLNSTATVRILANGYLSVDTHYVNRATVQCLGEDCPICSNNKILIMQYPETFREEAKYSPKRTVNLVNVLDKTPVKVCQDCGTENKAVPGVVACSKCTHIVTTDATPSNKVKVLSKGNTLFDQLDAINNAILDPDGERVGLTRYDITFVVSGAGKQKVITPIAGQITGDPVYNTEDLFDLENVTIKLSPSEMMDLQGGVSLKDIFAARRATEKSASFDAPIISKETEQSIEQDIETMFKH